MSSFVLLIITQPVAYRQVRPAPRDTTGQPNSNPATNKKGINHSRLSNLSNSSLVTIIITIHPSSPPSSPVLQFSPSTTDATQTQSELIPNIHKLPEAQPRFPTQKVSTYMSPGIIIREPISLLNTLIRHPFSSEKTRRFSVSVFIRSSLMMPL